MMKDYLAHRQNAIDGLSEDEINGWLNKLVNYLGGEVWLSKACNAAHPIVKLWNRKDFMSTNELVNFAQAVDTLEKIDQKWLKRTMGIVTGKDLNNTRGAIFEILALSIFSDNQCKVIPAASGNPGIDGTVIFPGEIKLNLSIKNFGISAAEKSFQQYMGEVYIHFCEEAEKRKLLTAELILEMKKYSNHPKEQAAVKELVRSALDRFKETASAGISGDIANVSIRPIQGYRFASGKCSHIFLASSPLQQNEYKNLMDKLDEACRNLIKQKPVESDTEYNGIVIHLHENADIDSYKRELQDYLDGHADDPISFIILYQPAIAFNQGTQQYGIYHTVKPVLSVNRIQDKPRIVPAIEFFVGSFGSKAPQRTLFVGNRSFAEVKDMYLYQKGEIYEQAIELAGSIEGQIRTVAPGIKLNSVVPFQGGTAILSPNTFETDYLEIT